MAPYSGGLKAKAEVESFEERVQIVMVRSLARDVQAWPWPEAQLGHGFGGLGLHKIVSQAQSQKAGLAGPGFGPPESPGPGLGLSNIPGHAQSPHRPTLGLGLA